MAPSQMIRPAQRKIAAILEVLGVYAAGQLLGYALFALFGSLLGIPLQNPLQEITPGLTQAHLLRITGRLLVLLVCQYAGWMALVLAVGGWRRRHALAHHGLTLAGHSFGRLLKVGVLLFAVAELFPKLLSLLDSLLPLGEQIAWREALYQLDWSTPAFWAFMAVGSYGLIPILEEVFYRGYVQTRLEEDFGAPLAIVSTAFLFAFSHSQYLVLNVFNVGMMLSLLLSAVAWGYIFYRTRSLLPTMIAHALVNLPLRGAGLWIQLVLMLVVIVVARRPIARTLLDGWALLRSLSGHWQGLAVAVAFGLFAVAFALLGDLVLLVGCGCFVAALILIAIEKRRTKKALLA